MFKHPLFSFLALGGLLLASAPLQLFAQERTPAEESEPAWESRLGAVAFVRPVSPGIDKYRLTPLPFVEVVYRHRYFLSTERGLGAVVFAADGLSLDTALHFDLGRREDWASVELHGMGDVDAAAVAAATLRYRTGGYSVALKARRALGSYDGLRGELSAGHRWEFAGGLSLSLEAYLAYADRNTAAAYYGIDAVQASRSGRAPYTLDAGLERWGGRLRLTRPLGRGWAVGALLDCGALLGDARKSPLTTEDVQLMQASLAVFYRF